MRSLLTLGNLVLVCLLAWVGITGMSSLSAADRSVVAVKDAIAAVLGVEAEGEGFEQAIPAAERLRQLPSADITRLLDAFADANPIAENWLRGIVSDVVRISGDPSVAALQNYALDRDRNPTGRGVAMELIQRQDPAVAATLIASCLEDPSLPLREMAVEQAISQAAELAGDHQADAAIAKYREALTSARHPRQLARILEDLGDLGQDVTTAEAFAMIRAWHGIGPFDNSDGVGFDTVYSPEDEFTSTNTVGLAKSHAGKSGSVAWQALEGSADAGIVDVAAAYGKEKGAVVYLMTEFLTPTEMPAEVRLATKNANKVWVNGEAVMSNEVYHSGGALDQYIARCQLRRGPNQILVKLCQNEQTESWAQEWQMQFRLTDITGKGLRSE